MFVYRISQLSSKELKSGLCICQSSHHQQLQLFARHGGEIAKLGHRIAPVTMLSPGLYRVWFDSQDVCKHPLAWESLAQQSRLF